MHKTLITALVAATVAPAFGQITATGTSYTVTSSVGNPVYTSTVPPTISQDDSSGLVYNTENWTCTPVTATSDLFVGRVEYFYNYQVGNTPFQLTSMQGLLDGKVVYSGGAVETRDWT